ncbi:MAG: hypothetical protein ACYYK0_05795 [Candidatus Eutrophobiaceae bacterium]
MQKNQTQTNGSTRIIHGKPCIYYDGYWIRHYDHTPETLAEKKHIIDQLTRRVFHHVEQGLNTSGAHLEQIRSAYESESDPALKRVKAAMLAGALLNRARDILTSIVELEERGVCIKENNEFLEMCNDCFEESLALCKNVHLVSGEEGLDELWGEPLRVYTLPLKEFYRTRYIKLAQTMSQIDRIGEIIKDIISSVPALKGAKKQVTELCKAAKEAAETLRSDPNNFHIWPQFVVSCEKLNAFQSTSISSQKMAINEVSRFNRAQQLLHDGTQLIRQLAMVRVAMPKSMNNFVESCDVFFVMK